MRLSLAVNGKTQSIASLQGPGFLNAHINLSDRPKEDERSNTVRMQGSHTAETETISMKWPTVEVQVGDVVEFRILPEGESDDPTEVRKSTDAPSNLLSDNGLAKELLRVVSDFDKRLNEFLEKAEKWNQRKNIAGSEEQLGPLCMKRASDCCSQSFGGTRN